MSQLTTIWQATWPILGWIVAIILVILKYGGNHIEGWFQGRRAKKLEQFKQQLLRTEKTAVISDLIVLLRKQNPSDDEQDKIDKHFLDLCLYLPPCLIHKLSHSMCRSGKDEDIGPLGVFVEIRSYIEGTYKADKNRKLTKENIPLTKRLVKVSASDLLNSLLSPDVLLLPSTAAKEVQGPEGKRLMAVLQIGELSTTSGK